jgi:transposase-like protein
MARSAGQPNHSPAVKQAVLAALLVGQGVDEVAGTYSLPRRTVARWRASLGSQELANLGHKKRDELGEMLMGYLREMTTTLTAQARFFRDKGWLEQQTAADLAVLHGVSMDKVFRLIEASERAKALKNDDRRPE